MLNIVGVLLVLSPAAVLAKFPDSIKRCGSGDSACVKRTSQDILINYPNGLRSLNLIPFDPLHVKSMVLKRNPDSPVNIELKFKDLDVIGLKNAHVQDINGYQLNQRSTWHALVPELILKGDYIIDGRVIIFPITGKGKSVITIKNLLLKYSFDLKPFEQNGETYARAENVKLESKPELVHYHFEGLFNGDKVLGDNMNEFLNENWRDIYDEMESGFAEALSLICKQLLNNILGKFPYNFLFPETQ